LLTPRPYVYHVKQHDLEGLKNAIKTARATPIGSYVPASMQFEAVCENTARVLEDDWRGKAEAVLKSGKGMVSLS
jgi:hypothetical protein